MNTSTLNGSEATPLRETTQQAERRPFELPSLEQRGNLEVITGGEITFGGQS